VFEISIVEVELGEFCGTMALVRVLISCSNLSKRADWDDAFAPTWLSKLSNLVSMWEIFSLVAASSAVRFLIDWLMLGMLVSLTFFSLAWRAAI
jgi:hypothetical protein